NEVAASVHTSIGRSSSDARYEQHPSPAALFPSLHGQALIRDCGTFFRPPTAALGLALRDYFRFRDYRKLPGSNLSEETDLPIASARQAGRLRFEEAPVGWGCGLQQLRSRFANRLKNQAEFADQSRRGLICLVENPFSRVARPEVRRRACHPTALHRISTKQA